MYLILYLKSSVIFGTQCVVAHRMNLIFEHFYQYFWPYFINWWFRCLCDFFDTHICLSWWWSYIMQWISGTKFIHNRTNNLLRRSIMSTIIERRVLSISRMELWFRKKIYTISNCCSSVKRFIHRNIIYNLKK